MRVTCGREWDKWTVRLDGIFVADFWLEKNAMRLAYNLTKALKA